MYELANTEMVVSVVDPVADRERLGSRYCTGGYIWQVTDRGQGELLSGPEYPNPTPRPFNGQGMPEVFETALGQETAEVGDDVLVIGVGLVRRTSPVMPFHVRNNPQVTEHCHWEVERQTDRLRMRTEQHYADWSLELEREVILDGRAVQSITRVRNSGKDELPLRWFAHPFFPLAYDGECCRFSLIAGMPINPGFTLNARGFVSMRRNHDWQKGWFQPLDLPWGEPVLVEQRHPRFDLMRVECSLPLAWMPVWANDHTFSFEPYLDHPLAAGTALEWTLKYDFRKFLPLTRDFTDLFGFNREGEF